MNFKNLTYLDSLVEKFEREKTSCLPRPLSTSTISQPRPLPRPPPSLHPILYFTTSVETQTGSLVRARCIGKIIGITFLVQKRTRFFAKLFTPFFLVSTNSLFSWNLYFRISNPLCFIRLGESLTSNPRLLRFCTSMPMISPTQRTLFQSLTSIFKRTMARGWGGGRVNCGRVHAIFNQEITPLGPHPNLILFDLLQCYQKLIHAVGDHHRPRKNARSLRTSCK